MKLIHYSDQPDLHVKGIDPAFHGTAAAGKELGRKKESNWLDRSYFYAHGTEPEPQLAGKKHKYSAEIADDKIYDMDADPKGLKAKSMWGPAVDPSLFEKNIKEAGYSGYHRPSLNNKTFSKIVTVFDKVMPTKDNDMKMEKAEQPMTLDMDEHSFQAASQIEEMLHHIQEIKGSMDPGKDLPDWLDSMFTEAASLLSKIAHVLDSYDQHQDQPAPEMQAPNMEKTIDPMVAAQMAPQPLMKCGDKLKQMSEILKNKMSELGKSDELKEMYKKHRDESDEKHSAKARPALIDTVPYETDEFGNEDELKVYMGTHEDHKGMMGAHHVLDKVLSPHEIMNDPGVHGAIDDAIRNGFDRVIVHQPRDPKRKGHLRVEKAWKPWMDT